MGAWYDITCDLVDVACIIFQSVTGSVGLKKIHRFARSVQDLSQFVSQASSSVETNADADSQCKSEEVMILVEDNISPSVNGRSPLQPCSSWTASPLSASLSPPSPNPTPESSDPITTPTSPLIPIPIPRSGAISGIWERSYLQSPSRGSTVTG